jgi:amidase
MIRSGITMKATTPDTNVNESRRALFRSVTALAFAAAPSRRTGAQSASSDPSDEIIYMSATKLAGLIRARDISATEAVDAYIVRQQEVNDRLNAVVMRCHERARAEAQALDRRAARREFAGPLHGVPMTIKDSFDTEGVISTGGTYGRQQYVPPKDATAVARLRRQGAILLGKTNTPEFTLGGIGSISTSSNMLYGSSHNPYDLSHTTSGSSGGAGAIVAAGGAAFDIGSDFGGSIRFPAHVNGIAGLKTTAGRVPRTGHIVDYGGVFDLWQQLGPMARRVEDLALIAPVISGPDYRDAACIPVPWSDPREVALDGLRAAYFIGNGDSSPDPATEGAVAQAVAWVEEVAASMTEDCPTELIETIQSARTKLVTGDGWQWYKRLADKWGTKNISPSMAETIASASQIPTDEFVETWERCDEAKSRLLTWMDGYDVLLCPVSKQAATPIDRDSTPDSGALGYVGTFNSSGWPVAVVRCGTAEGGLPIGIQVVAPPWREDVCIAVASYIESKSGGWQPPPI